MVTSTAVQDDNPEVLEARERMIPVIPRAEMLAELMRMKYGIAIAGTHGKTTTTSMVATVLTHGGIDPTIVIGGKLNTLGTNAELGQGKFLVAEADESDGSFLKLSPTIAVVTNIDADHLDFYTGGIEQIKDIFVDFINKIPFYGLAVLCLDDDNIADIIPRVKKRFVTYGLSSQADIRATHIRLDGGSTSFVAHYKGYRMGEITFAMPGAHNVLNALACIAVAMELDVPFNLIQEGFAGFGGVGRRFQVKAEMQRHHGGGRLRPPSGRDQGHPGGRQGWLARAQAGGGFPAPPLHADQGTVRRFCEMLLRRRCAGTDRYLCRQRDSRSRAFPPRRWPTPSKSTASGMSPISPTARHCPSIWPVSAKPGDIVMTLGAGNIWQAGEGFLKRLQEYRRHGCRTRSRPSAPDFEASC